MASGSSRLAQGVVEAVREAVDILDIAGDATRLKKRGNRYLGLCPFHKEKSPSFSVDPDQGLFYCFGCGAGGDAIRLHQQLSGDDFLDAIEALARRYGIAIQHTADSRSDGPTQRIGPALEAAAEFFRHALGRSEVARNYLERRRIPPDLAEHFELGYAPDGWRHLLTAIGERVPPQALEAAGLIATPENGGQPYDRFRNRLIFPIHSPIGRLVGFGGRTLGDDRAKYINTRETEQFHKGKLLYGFHQAKKSLREGRKAVLVEGYTDVMAAAAAGIDYAVAGMGTALTAEQARLLARYADEVILGYDGDEAGQKAASRSLPLLLAEGLAVRRARFPAGHDPDSVRLAEGPHAVTEIIEAADDAVWDAILKRVPAAKGRTPIQVQRAAQEIVTLLNIIRDPIVRKQYGRRAAERLGAERDLIVNPHGVSVFKPQLARETSNYEETILRMLLDAQQPTPTLDLLPPAEAFFSSPARNIFSAFCALYKQRDGIPPTPGEVRASLGGDESADEGAIDLLARILLKQSDSGDGRLEDALTPLRKRWVDEKRRELNRLIKQADMRKDHTELARLLEEKKDLNLARHPEMTGKFW